MLGITGSTLLTDAVAWLLLACSTAVLALATSWLAQDVGTLSAEAWKLLSACLPFAMRAVQAS